MTIHELFTQRWETEQPAFRKVLQAVPDSGLEYRPHERSTSAGDLAWQLAREQRDLIEILDKGETSWAPTARPGSIDEIVKAWDSATAELREKLAKTSEDRLQSEARMLVGDQVVWRDSLQNMLWGYLFDMVHHRGQLSTYLRPMGSKVPAIYGPSADDQG